MAVFARRRCGEAAAPGKAVILLEKALIPVSQPPIVPAAWDYDESVKRVQQIVYRWKELTVDMLSELWIARECLSQPGRPWGRRTWDGYCQEIGVARRVINRWLERAFLTGTKVPVISVLPPGMFRVVYADPPWEYENSGFETSAASHYPTLPIEDICAYHDSERRPIQDIIGPSAVLFLWVTNPMLEEGLKVCEAWGFEYKTNLVWTKPNTMAGFYALGQHELLFIATRGSCLPNKGTPPPSVIVAPRHSHSEKPEEVYELIESMYEGPYIEGFARKRRPGWEAWGYDVTNQDDNQRQNEAEWEPVD